MISRPLPTSRHNQRGAVLIVGLVMLLLLTIIGVAASRTGLLQEKMAGNMRDRQLAFQAAESALRAGEDILDNAALPAFDGSVAGYGPRVAQPGSPDWWENSFNWAAQSVLTNYGLSIIASQPRYYIERVDSVFATSESGSGVDFESQLKIEPDTMFRVTARGAGATDQTVVILQSTYKR